TSSNGGRGSRSASSATRPMTVLHVTAALALASCVGLAAQSRTDAPDGGARIEVDRQPDRYHVTALYDGPVSEGLTYRLEVLREGASGRSRSSQGGAVRDDTLSTLTVNTAPGDRVTARLTVHDGAAVTAEAEVDETVRP